MCGNDKELKCWLMGLGVTVSWRVEGDGCIARTVQLESGATCDSM